MKLILHRDGVKREIEAPFHICLSSDDLDALIAALQGVRRRWTEACVSYGQELIDPDKPVFPVGPPRKWAEP